MRVRALSIVLLLAVLGLTACSGTDSGGVAFSIDGDEFSDDELFDELRVLERSELFRTAFLQVPELNGDLRGPANGSYKQDAVRWVIELRIFFAFIQHEFERRELELTSAAREQAELGFQGFDFQTNRDLDVDDLMARFPAEYRQRWIDDQARLTLLQEQFETIDAFSTWINETARGADVEVNSRFGSWDAANLSVVSPEGASTSTSDTASAVPVP